MMNDPMSRYALARSQQCEALREAALDGQVKAARSSQVGLSVLLLFAASRVLFALSQRLKALAEAQAMRA